MVCEWVDGIRFEQVLELEQEQRDRVGEILVRFFFGSVQHLGRFNTDPHPGNYMLMEDGRMAFLDFGNTAAVSGEWVELAKRVLRAAVDGNLDDFARVMDGLGYVRNLDRSARFYGDVLGWRRIFDGSSAESPFTAAAFSPAFNIAAGEGDPSPGFQWPDFFRASATSFGIYVSSCFASTSDATNVPFGLSVPSVTTP